MKKFTFKILSICLSAAVMLSAFAIMPMISSAAVEPVKLFDFYSEDSYEDNAPVAPNGCEVEWAENALHFTARTEGVKNGDTHFTVANSGGFSADDTPYMVIKLKNLSEHTNFEMYFGTDINPMTPKNVLHFTMSAKDSQYQTYIINVPEANLATAYPLNGEGGEAQLAGSTHQTFPELEESMWTGNVTTIRFDSMYNKAPGGNVTDGSEMYIEYAAFFETKEDAEAFKATGPDRSGSQQPSDPTAPPSADDIKPNADVFINFSDKANPDYSELVMFGAGNLMTFEDYNADGTGVVFSIPEKSDDPYISMSILEEVDAAEWPVIQMKIKNSSGKTPMGSIYYDTDMHAGFGEDKVTLFKYKDTTDWQIINVNLNEKKNGSCEGYYNNFRLDLLVTSPNETEIEVAYIAFFKSVKAAEQYIENGGDFSELVPTAKPTSEITPTPEATATSTADNTATEKPSATLSSSETPKDGDNNGSMTIVIVIIVCAAIAAAIVIAVVVMKKKKK